MQANNSATVARIVCKAIRSIFEPALADLGLLGKYPEYRRRTQDELHFVRIFTAKFGGSFSYTAAWLDCAPGTDERELSIADTPFDNRGTVQRMIELWSVTGERHMAAVGGYEYGLLGGDEPACRALVTEAASLLPAVDRWLRTRKASDCIVVGGARIGGVPNFGLVSLIADAKARQGLY